MGNKSLFIEGDGGVCDIKKNLKVLVNEERRKKTDGSFYCRVLTLFLIEIKLLASKK